MQTPQQASVFRSVESMLCTNYSDEDCTNKTNEFHDYVTYLALENELLLSETYDLLSTCAPCIEKTFLDSTHNNCNKEVLDSSFTCGDLSNHVKRATTIFNMTFSPDDTSYAFENAYDVTDICEACFDNGEDCDNDVSEFLENMATCADVANLFPDETRLEEPEKSNVSEGLARLNNAECGLHKYLDYVKGQQAWEGEGNCKIVPDLKCYKEIKSEETITYDSNKDSITINGLEYQKSADQPYHQCTFWEWDNDYNHECRGEKLVVFDDSDMINIVRLDGEISDKQIKDEMKKITPQIRRGEDTNEFIANDFIYKCKERVQ